MLTKIVLLGLTFWWRLYLIFYRCFGKAWMDRLDLSCLVLVITLRGTHYTANLPKKKVHARITFCFYFNLASLYSILCVNLVLLQ